MSNASDEFTRRQVVILSAVALAGIGISFIAISPRLTKQEIIVQNNCRGVINRIDVNDWIRRGWKVVSVTSNRIRCSYSEWGIEKEYILETWGF